MARGNLANFKGRKAAPFKKGGGRKRSGGSSRGRRY